MLSLDGKKAALGVLLALGSGVVALGGCGSQKSVSFGTISTIAGKAATPGYAGDGGAATAALLGTPACLALDAAGNLYVSDSTFHVVRRVNAAGTISTYAGDGTAGYTGDNGAATAAQLNAPNGCALDAAGNLYIADTGNNVVRKVTAATGVITTVAGTGTAGFGGEGGPPVVANLNHPFGVAVDSTGNLYISDTQNQRVRKVTFAANTIVTVAGKGSYGYTGDGGAATAAELYNPEGLLVTSAGDVLVAEEANGVVRKITGTSGKISTVAGGSKYGFAGDGGAATDAQLQGPTSVAMDSAGNLYISDTGNMEIRRVAMDGTIVTVAGDGTQGFAGDGKAATSAKLNRPRAVVIGSSGAMYIADTGNAVVRKVGP